jgi:hypothetical protein
MSYQSGFPSDPNPYRPSAQQPDWGASPYRPPDLAGTGYPPPRPSRTWLWILLGIGGLILAVPLCCLGCGGALMHLGFEAIEAEIVDDLNTDPVIQQHLGHVESAEMHFWDSLMEEVKNPSGDDEDSWYVFDLKGTKGKGRAIGRCITSAADVEELHEGRLLLPDGREVKLSK